MNFVKRAVATLGLAAVFAVPAGGVVAEEEASFGWGLNPYVGAGLGLAMTDETFRSGALVAAIEDEAFEWSAFAGIEFNDYVAIEGFYKDFGKHDFTLSNGVTTVSLGEIDYDAFGTSILLTLPFDETFSGYFRTGIHFWESESTLTGFKNDGTDWHLGGGLNVVLTESLNLRAEYGYYEIDAGGGAEVDIQDLTASLVYVF